MEPRSQAERDAAQAMPEYVTRQPADHHRSNHDEIHALVAALGGLLGVLRHADPADKAEVYRELGLRLTYDHQTPAVLAETQPTPPMGLLVVSEEDLHTNHTQRARDLTVGTRRARTRRMPMPDRPTRIVDVAMA